MELLFIVLYQISIGRLICAFSPEHKWKVVDAENVIGRSDSDLHVIYDECSRCGKRKNIRIKGDLIL